MMFSRGITRVNHLFSATRSFSTFKKVQVKGAVVDMDGDEMTRIIWQWIKDKVSQGEFLTLFVAYPPLCRCRSWILRSFSTEQRRN